jgi:hypothetical protein
VEEDGRIEEDGKKKHHVKIIPKKVTLKKMWVVVFVIVLRATRVLLYSVVLTNIIFSFFHCA